MQTDKREKKMYEPIAISVKEAAELSPFGERTIRRMIKSGEIKSNLVGGRRVIPYAPFKELLG